MKCTKESSFFKNEIDNDKKKHVKMSVDFHHCISYLWLNIMRSSSQNVGSENQHLTNPFLFFFSYTQPTWLIPRKQQRLPSSSLVGWWWSDVVCGIVVVSFWCEFSSFFLFGFPPDHHQPTCDDDYFKLLNEQHKEMYSRARAEAKFVCFEFRKLGGPIRWRRRAWEKEQALSEQTGC